MDRQNAAKPEAGRARGRLREKGVTLLGKICYNKTITTRSE